MAPVEQKVNWAGGLRAKSQFASFEYSFAADGGAVSAITLRGRAIPAGSVVLDAIVKTVTPLTSGGSATVALKIEGAGDLQAATAYSASPYAAAGAVHGGALDRSKAPVVTTAARSPVATVAVAALTAGKFVVLIEYIANVTD